MTTHTNYTDEQIIIVYPENIQYETDIYQLNDDNIIEAEIIENNTSYKVTKKQIFFSIIIIGIFVLYFIYTLRFEMQ